VKNRPAGVSDRGARVDGAEVHDVSRLEERHAAAWSSAAGVATIAAVAWLVLVLAVRRLGHVDPAVLLAASALAGLAVGVRLPAAAPTRHRAVAPFRRG
jgi:hypothetical protein